MGIRARSWRYFVAAAATAGISLLTLPLTTRVLGPRDYGLLALATVIAGFGPVLATLGAGYLVAQRWAGAGEEARTALVSTVTLNGVVVAGVWGVAVGLLDVFARQRVDVVAELPDAGLALLLLGGVAAVPWVVAAEVLTLEGRAALFSAATVVQAVVIAVVTLLCLFVFDLETMSLFVGAAAGSFAALVTGAAVLRRHLRPRYDREVRRGLSRRSFLAAQLAETGQPLLERILLSRFAGFFDLGLYSHSQRYFGIAQTAVKSVGRGVWPVTLDEARDADGAFPATARTWNAIHVAVTATGLAAILLGSELVALLTNDKFTQAATLFFPWFVLLLLQQSAKPDIGTLYAHAPGTTIARISLGAAAAGLVGAAVLIPLFETYGAAAALVLQAVVYRVAVRMPARRLRHVPFQDWWALFGIALLAAAFAYRELGGDSLFERLAVLALLECVCIAGSARVVAETFSALPRPRFSRG